MRILAIDPGSKESGIVIWDGYDTDAFGKIENNEMFLWLECKNLDVVVIEQVKSYGMAVGETVFETVYWSGRFAQFAINFGIEVDRMPRMDVKMHLCHSPRAKDSNIMQALIDRYAPNTRNRGKGTKKEPGFFYGFKSDIWAAFALAVTYYDLKGEK
jgi:hypothetical protein